MYTPETPVTYILSDVKLDTKKPTATLRIRELGKRSGTVLRLVPISGQLASRIKLHREDPKKMAYENVEFTSTLNDDRFVNNPLKLVKFIKDDTVEYRIQIVDDKGHEVKRFKNAAQKWVDKVYYFKWRPTQYMRYWEVDMRTA